MELFTLTFDGTVTQLYEGRAIRLFYLDSNYSNIFYLTNTNELYNNDDRIATATYQHFIDLTRNTLRLRLSDDNTVEYFVSLHPSIGSSGILL